MKATRLRLPVAEIPTIWLDRSLGDSRFELVQLAPRLPALVPVRVRPEARLSDRLARTVRETDRPSAMATRLAG